ncbi:flagellar biosynthetic protein FliR [Megalodesulfovibrio paquesii]
MEFMGLTPENVLSFMLTLFRLSVVLFLLPFFGGDKIPNPIKAALVIVLTMAIWPYLKFPASAFPGHPISILLMMLGEMVLGLTMGLVVNFIFAAIQTGGQLIGFQMGLTMSNVIDPMSGQSEGVTAHVLWMVTMLIFLSFNGHLYLLKAVALTFDIIPPGGLVLRPALVEQVLQASGQMFSLGIRIAAPVLVALFLVDLGLALVARAAPQMNVLFVGFPLKLGVGFFFMGMLFTIMSDYMQDFIGQMSRMYEGMLQLMQ